MQPKRRQPEDESTFSKAWLKVTVLVGHNFRPRNRLVLGMTMLWGIAMTPTVAANVLLFFFGILHVA
jgi:hypothetical protein